jgi:hypothetical protein
MEVLLAMQEDSKTQRDERKIDKEEMMARMDANTKAMLATQVKMNKTKEDMKTMQQYIQENLKKTMEEMLTATQAKTDVKLKELTEPREELMQSVEEHQQVPREDAVVILVKRRKRRHRGREEAAGRNGEPNKLTQGDCGSRKKLSRLQEGVPPCNSGMDQEERVQEVLELRIL